MNLRTINHIKKTKQLECNWLEEDTKLKCFCGKQAITHCFRCDDYYCNKHISISPVGSLYYAYCADSCKHKIFEWSLG